MSKLLAQMHSIVVIFSILSCNPFPDQSKAGFNFYESDFFKEVQLSGIFPDSKTFVDCTPKQPLPEINALYLKIKDKPEFQLREFVLKHFELPVVPVTGFKTDTAKSMYEHISSLWPVLTRQPDEYDPWSSLIPLPNPYIVPGGRFGEIYYWDSYFTITGLMASGREELAKDMTDNFAYLIDTLGFIPNGNRDYFLGRSQPPFFSLMVDLIARSDRDLFIQYLPRLEKEYHFWMEGAERLDSSYQSYKRVVRMADGTVLNRYWDNFSTPRPEAFKVDYELVRQHKLDPAITYRHLRATAESGWDFSSRWFRDHRSLKTIHTTEIIPVDLNSLLYHLELKIAQGYNWKGNLKMAEFYLEKAGTRKNAINKYLWDPEDMFFVDFDFETRKPTGALSLAGAFPLFFKLASKAQARAVVNRLLEDFLCEGGFVTTLNETGQQWDAPNGWAPLQWITINALYNYGFGDEGNAAAETWLQRNNAVYKATGKMMEKYNVINTRLLAGGGEYPLQDGFGWTNGVAVALNEILEEKKLVEEMGD